MTAKNTNHDLQQLAAAAEHFTLVILKWTPDRFMPGAEAIELQHQQRLASLRTQRVIAVIAPILSGELGGVLMIRATLEEAAALINEDPCVKAGMQTYELHPCIGLFEEAPA